MKISYNLKAKQIISRSFLTKSSLNDALFYVKKGSLVSFKTTYTDNYDFASKVLKEETLQKTFKVHSNTSNILITDISFDDVPYFYEVLSSDGSRVTEQDVILNSIYTVKAANGRLYTNDLIQNYEIKDGTFLYSVPVVSNTDMSIKYNDRFISISVQRKGLSKYYAKPATATVAEVSKVSSSKILIPSFYIETRKGFLKFIEGDVTFHTKKELLDIEYNSIYPKDIVVSYKDTANLFLDTSVNTFYSNKAYLTSQEILVEYLSKNSNHVFEISSFLYFKLSKQGLLKATENDFDIKIEKVINMNEIEIIPNNFLNTYEYQFKPTEIGLRLTDASFEEKDYVRFIKQETIQNPSEVFYVKLLSKSIKQGTLNEEDVPLISKDFFKNAVRDYSFTNKLKETSQSNLVQIQTYYKECLE